MDDIDRINGSVHMANFQVNGNEHASDEAVADKLPIANNLNHAANGHTREASYKENNGQAFMPIAICGMACRLPGDISSPTDMWNFLTKGGDARSTVPDTRWNASAYYSAVQKKGLSCTQHGYYLDEGIDLGALDRAAFPMSRNEIERMDPQHRLLLEVAHECMDDSGEIDWKGSNTGVYVGSFGQDWYDVLNRETLKYSAYQLMGSHDFMISERISHELDFHGPCLTIRTGCSSSLIALNDACSAIAKGDCKGALVGGTNLILAPSTVTSLSELGAFSPDGSSKTFSADANGYGRGEGIVAVYVKSLADALRDGNPIRAVVSGIATNFDGKTPTLGRPSAIGQEAAIRRAYEVAGISEIWKTGLFECHGTGTAAGDPIEASAIAAVFGKYGIYISSLKPNLGHSEGAAGLSAVLKAVLALQHRTIPPSIKAWPLNPKIPFQTANLTVASECIPWPAGRHERVSINSFGKGGANGHAIIDSAKSYGLSPNCDVGEKSSDVLSLFVYSAYSSKSLERMSQNIERFLETTTESFPDIAYTLARRRQHLPYRSFVVSAEHKSVEPLPALTQYVNSTRTPVMVFTGQGAQWPQMGRDLLGSNRVFSETIVTLDEELQRLGANWTIEDELRKMSRKSRVNEADFSQPLCTAIQIALVETLASVGVKPAAVTGHSSGEIAAAYAAGALTLSEAIAVAFHRGKISKTQTKHGAMAAVSMSWDEANDYLLPGVVTACDNSPSSITLSGDADQLANVVANIKKARPEIITSILKVERAYHSHHMREIGEAYHQAMLVSGVVGDRNVIPFFSSVTGKLLSSETEQTILGPKYWQENLESPVRFKSAVTELLNHVDISNSVFLEIGPHPALEGPIRQILATESRSAPYIPTLKRRQNGTESLLMTIGKLWTLHVDVEFAGIMPTGGAVNDLPSYLWDYEKTYWYEPRVSREWRLGGHPYHDLLGRKLPESTDMEPIWRNLLHLENVPWVLDHRIDGDIIFPFAAFLAIAAEAVQQVSEARETVEMRNVVVGSALPVSEEAPTELVTAFRRARLTDFWDSDWWDFSISSHNGHVWTKHCTGQVRQGADSNLTEASYSTLSQLPRKVDNRSWYEAVHRKRLTYGLHFTTMEEISSSAAAPSKALANLRNNWHGDEENYYLHPVVIDSFFQLLSLAAHDGLGHIYRRQVPTSIDHLIISRCRSDQLRVFVEGELTQDGGASGQGQCSAGSKIVSQFSGLRLSLFEGAESTTVNNFPLTARSQWVPHIGFTDVSTIFRDVDVNPSDIQIFEELVRLAVQNSQQMAFGTKPPSPALQKYVAWLKEQDVATSENTNEAESRSSIESMVERLQSSPFSYVAKATVEICSNFGEIMSGQRDAYDVLATDGILEGLLEFMSDYDSSEFFRQLAHFKPNLRVLELGVGSGAATARILQCLRHKKGQKLFSRYVVTAASAGLVDAARSWFKGVTDLDFAVLNIERDLADQEFDGEEFDLIIAAGVLHSSTDVLKSLANVRKLLSPKGRLLVQEPSSGLLWAKFILGILPSWWSGQDDSRSDGPFMSQEEWEEKLASAGFGRPKIVDRDGSAKGQRTIMIVQPEHQQSLSNKVTVMCGNSTPETDLICHELQAQGYDIARCMLDERPTPGQDIIALVDLEGPFLWDLSEDRLKRFQTFVNNLKGSGVLWVTRQCQGGVKDPRYAPIIGLIRTIRSELAANFATCESEVLDTSQNLKSLVGVFRDFQDQRFDGVLGPEYEYAISNGMILVNRFFPFELNIEIQESHQLPETSLAIGKIGQLGTLHWSARSGLTVEGDEVEVEIHATGLNFRDILVATGILTLPETNFGYEAAGIVTKVGTKATKLSLGDRVTLVGHKTFSTRLVLSEMLCEKIPDSMSLLDAAGSPLCFATAIYGLMDIGRVEEGQSVLIHSATGGVGIAAIQVAKMLKAEIYVTVGSAHKRKYLIDNLGIPDERISDSRSPTFMTDILRQTKGKGVDVALNSLSGELLHQTWSCIAKWGTMVEIGKRDLLGSAKLDMKPFSDNRNYCCIDMDQMAKERPNIIAKILRRLIDYFHQGYLQPLPLAQVFPSPEVAEAFKYMQQSKHIGKIVVELRDSGGKLRVTDTPVPQKLPVQLDSSAAYLLVGGLGGLGRSTARYMVQQGARNLIFLSRSADKNDPRHEDFVKEIESMGSTVLCVKGNVAQQECVERAIDEAAGPVKGILNMTIDVADEAFLRMTIQDWNTSTEPKVKGTWNILQTVKSRRLTLDFLVLISSLSGVIGQAGQANYSSANTFMDAFSQYSTSQGLPCTTITSGVMEDIGVMKNQVEILRRLQGSGWRLNTEAELIDVVDSAIQLQTRKRDAKEKYTPTSPEEVDKTKFTFGLCPTVPLSDPDSYTNLRADVRMAVYHNSKWQSNKSTATEDKLLALLNAAKKDTSVLESIDSVNVLAMEIGKKLCSLLLLPDDKLIPSTKTVEMGLDSLVAVEMGAWWKVTFGLEISTLEVVSMGTLQALGKRAAEGLIRVYS